MLKEISGSDRNRGFNKCEQESAINVMQCGAHHTLVLQEERSELFSYIRLRIHKQKRIGILPLTMDCAKQFVECVALGNTEGFAPDLFLDPYDKTR